MYKFLTVALSALLLTACAAPATLPTAKATSTRVTAQKNDLQVTRATDEIKTQLEANYNDFYRRFVTLNVSPTPLGTLFTFRGTVVEGNLIGVQKRYELRGTYNSLTREVKVIEQKPIAQ